MSETLKLDVDARGVATLTLNRPEVHNAFGDLLIAELTEAFERLEADPAVRVVVLTGAGKSFSAGGDLKWMQAMIGYSEAQNRADSLNLAELMHRLDQLAKPTVARVNGAALGGGVGLVACCDIAIGAEGAKFGLTEVRLGLAPAVIAPFVVRAIGARQARRYFLSGERFDSATALRLGLLHERVPPDALDATVGAVVDTLLAGGPQALAACKALVATAEQDWDRDRLKRETAALIARLRTGDEGQEGLAAFFDKRSPRWVEPS